MFFDRRNASAYELRVPALVMRFALLPKRTSASACVVHLTSQLSQVRHRTATTLRELDLCRVRRTRTVGTDRDGFGDQAVVILRSIPINLEVWSPAEKAVSYLQVQRERNIDHTVRCESRSVGDTSIAEAEERICRARTATGVQPLIVCEGSADKRRAARHRIMSQAVNCEGEGVDAASSISCIRSTIDARDVDVERCGVSSK